MGVQIHKPTAPPIQTRHSNIRSAMSRGENAVLWALLCYQTFGVCAGLVSANTSNKTAKRQLISSMFEMSLSREHHRGAEAVDQVDGLLILHRAARLDDRGDAGFEEQLGAVGEREEGIAGRDR